MSDLQDLNMSDLQDLVDGYTWCTITADAPDWYVCPVFKTMLREQEAFDKACTPLSFAPYGFQFGRDFGVAVIHAHVVKRRMT
ncbi:hypothetical protein N0V85_005477 [Neurospora sp. IMI 360204]|nr:hypothetical protein N0V85_005477 [Neurospora sp. IMI 360204]